MHASVLQPCATSAAAFLGVTFGGIAYCLVVLLQVAGVPGFEGKASAQAPQGCLDVEFHVLS
jgi:hypothetical protein